MYLPSWKQKPMKAMGLQISPRLAGYNHEDCHISLPWSCNSIICRSMCRRLTWCPFATESLRGLCQQVWLVSFPVILLLEPSWSLAFWKAITWGFAWTMNLLSPPTQLNGFATLVTEQEGILESGAGGRAGAAGWEHWGKLASRKCPSKHYLLWV